MYNSHQESIHHYRDQVAMVCPSLFISQQLCSDREIRCVLSSTAFLLWELHQSIHQKMAAPSPLSERKPCDTV